jgi:hypothetical protein
MKKLMLLSLLLIAAPSFAQDASAPAAVPAPAPVAAPVAPAPAPAVVAAPAVQSLDLFQIGNSFGKNKSWEVGIDKSPVLDACIQREVHDGQWLAGPCRDVLVLAKMDASGMLHPVAHLGAAIMYNAEHGNASFAMRAGVNVGPAAHALLSKMADDIPGLEGISNITLPKWASYIGSVTTIDYAMGYRPVHDASVNGNLTHGPMAKMSIPLDDLYSLVKIGI